MIFSIISSCCCCLQLHNLLFKISCYLSSGNGKSVLDQSTKDFFFFFTTTIIKELWVMYVLWVMC